jgi:hypothetical protein
MDGFAADRWPGTGFSRVFGQRHDIEVGGAIALPAQRTIKPLIINAFQASLQNATSIGFNLNCNRLQVMAQKKGPSRRKTAGNRALQCVSQITGLGA